MKATLIARTEELIDAEKIAELINQTIEAYAEGNSTLVADLLGQLRQTVGNPYDLNSLFTLGGKLAGICYMPDNYCESAIQDIERANKRANTTTNSGHHSVFDHGYATILFEGLPKMLAMLLNSTEVYTTSEKSARYTVMKPETQLETDTYNKWKEKLIGIISDRYPNIEEKAVAKLAQENARYMISVFTPTTMAYTVSYRQANYLVDWCDKLIISLDNLAGDFNSRLRNYVIELRIKLLSIIGEKTITDNKNRYFEFMPVQAGYPNEITHDLYDDAYSISYMMSFAGLAQAQRHRTIHYEMTFKGTSSDEYGYYIPKILWGKNEITAEWLNDIKKVGYCYPQGTLVTVTEQGLAKDFFLKCKERMCGRAQLEIMYRTTLIFNEFMKHKDILSQRNKEILDGMTQHGVGPRCTFNDFDCKEHCIWGAKSGLTRNI